MRPFLRLSGYFALALSSLTMHGQIQDAHGAALQDFEQSLESTPTAIIGDSDHSQPLLRFIGSDEVLDALQHAGKKYIGIEFMPYAQKAIDQLVEGRITRKDFIDLFTAQANVRHFTFWQNTEIIAADEADLILNAHRRGIGIILFDRHYRQDRVEHDYKKAFRASEKLNRKQKSGPGNNPIHFISLEEIDNRNRISPAVNQDMVAIMINAVRSREKSNGHHSMGWRHDSNRMPDFAIFIGWRHCDQIAQALQRKGLGSTTSYLFADEDSMKNLIDKFQHAIDKSPDAKNIALDQENYLVRDGWRWHWAGEKSSQLTVSLYP